jgi:hypothetical protein
MCEAIEDFDEVEKLGQGFSSADSLEKIDIGDGITPSFLKMVYVIRLMAALPSTSILETGFPSMCPRMYNGFKC